MNDSGSTLPRDGGATSRRIGGDTSLLGAVRGWLRSRRRPRNGETVREALEELIEDRDSAEIPIDDHERQLLGNILHLRDVTAQDVKVPRADIIAVEAGTSLDGLIRLFIECGHSRLPVYRRILDDVIGMVHIKDLLEVMGQPDKPFNLPRLARRVQFVAPSMRVTDLLLEMRLRRAHLALVVDEYGGIDGLVTIEDLVEQIVGEIEDEHDEDEEPDLVALADGSIEADARTAIAEFEASMGAVLTEEEREEVETLGGLVFFVAGRVPSRGELITHSAGLEFEVLDADPRRVKRVRVRRMGPAPASPPPGSS
ncbi:transporter associated domain-containing protein [Magnetospirillum sp. SS-4]|uniref:transporter associated domain-containing protein n=1 Tax=Magnetospirillum sp. SS-4 TaxID=2681465 RepID=UPI00138541AC|nr:transporter associated domain-containing protein [Magnetospirillum sp. SS-4]CAA7621351.1 Hemolysins and related protein containing CBS domains [Magnetospirillum sp. SS-4]